VGWPAAGSGGAAAGAARTGRTYRCARAGCQAQVLVCSHCDRGQRYCSVACRDQARREAQREAGRRYQSTRAGRFAHARRARRYRQRQKNVTHQSSQAARCAPTLVADPVEAEVAKAVKVTRGVWRCWWCPRECLPMVRHGFVRPGRVRCDVAPQGSKGPVHGQSP